MNSKNNARFISNDFRKTTSLTPFIDKDKIVTIQQKTILTRLYMVYEIHNKQAEANISDCYTLSRTASVNIRHRHSLISSRTDAYKYSFYSRTITAWNTISLSTIAALSMQKFINIIKLQLPESKSSCS